MRVVLKNLMRRNPAIFNPLWAFLYPLIYRRDGKYFGSDYLDGQQAFQTIFEEIAGDHPGYAAVAGAPYLYASLTVIDGARFCSARASSISRTLVSRTGCCGPR
jgi:hypothetical protein